jgi:hypothetical protein
VILAASITWTMQMDCFVLEVKLPNSKATNACATRLIGVLREWP